MSRTSSRTGVERNPNRVQPSTSSAQSKPLPPLRPIGSNLAATVRPSLSFANAAAKKDQYPKSEEDIDNDAASESQDIAKLAL